MRGLEWKGIGFRLGGRQEAELFAVLAGLRHLASRRESGQHYVVFTDSQAAMRIIQSDTPGAGQDMALGCTAWARGLLREGNAVMVR